MKTIAITGSSGYIGSCVAEFLNKKYKIYLIDKKKPQKIKKNFIQCNLIFKSKLKKIINSIKPSIVIHLAGESTIDNIKNKKKYILNNIKVTNNILEIIKKNECDLIFASTAAIYSSSSLKIKENFKKKLDNIYAITKFNNEKKIIKTYKKLRNNFVILRFFNVCSSLFDSKCGEIHSPETHLIPIIVNKFLKNKKVKIYSNNKNQTCIRDYIHIRDLCRAIENSIKYIACNRKSNIFNLGGGKSFSTLQVVNFFKKNIAKNKLKFEFTKKRIGDKKRLVCSNRKIFKELSWKPQNSSLKKIFKDELLWQKYLDKKNINRKMIY